MPRDPASCRIAWRTRKINIERKEACGEWILIKHIAQQIAFPVVKQSDWTNWLVALILEGGRKESAFEWSLEEAECKVLICITKVT